VTRLGETALSDHFRDGIAEERQALTGRGSRAEVLTRMRKWQAELEFLTDRRERLLGRLVGDNEWLNQHPDGGA